MREQIKVLEYHTDIFSQLVDICLFVIHMNAIDDDFSCRNILKTVQTTEKR